MSSVSGVRTSVKSPRQFQPATKPVTGKARWAVRPTQDRDGVLVVVTGSKNRQVRRTYTVEELVEQCCLVGYRLHREDGSCYDIDLTDPHGWRCDCPDATFHPERPGGCKHIRALQVALDNL